MNTLRQITKIILLTLFWVVLLKILQTLTKTDNDLLFFIGLATIQLYCFAEKTIQDRK